MRVKDLSTNIRSGHDLWWNDVLEESRAGHLSEHSGNSSIELQKQTPRRLGAKGPDESIRSQTRHVFHAFFMPDKIEVLLFMCQMFQAQLQLVTRAPDHPNTSGPH